MRDTRRPGETPLEQTAPDLEQEVDPDGLGEARLRDDVARTEADYADDAPDDGAPSPAGTDDLEDSGGGVEPLASKFGDQS